MPLSDVINVIALIGASPIGVAAFSTPMVAADLTGPQDTAFGSDDVREVTPATWRAVMTEIGVASNEDLYLALTDMFSQVVKPSLVLLGIRLTAVAQRMTYTIPGSPANGVWTITIDGNDCSFTASSSTQTQVRDGLIAAVDGTVGTLVDAAIGSASTLTVTALAPGRPFTSSVASPASVMTQATTIANTGLPEDFAAWQAVRDDFYFVMETGHDDDDIIALAGAIEASATPKLYIAQSTNAVAQTAGTDDVGNVLRLAGYARTAVFWHDDVDDFVDAAAIGRLAVAEPGSTSWANNELRSVAGIVPTSVSNLTTKNYSWLESYPAKGVSATRRGRVADGTPIDLIIAADFARDLVQSRLFSMELSVPKVPYTAKGATMVEGVVRNAVVELASDRYQIADLDTLEITIPEARAQSDEDQAARYFPGVIAAFAAQGAIETIGVTLNIAQAA